MPPLHELVAVTLLSLLQALTELQAKATELTGVRETLLLAAQERAEGQLHMDRMTAHHHQEIQLLQARVGQVRMHECMHACPSVTASNCLRRAIRT